MQLKIQTTIMAFGYKVKVIKTWLKKLLIILKIKMLKKKIRNQSKNSKKLKNLQRMKIQQKRKRNGEKESQLIDWSMVNFKQRSRTKNSRGSN